jgi:hypothetical protein
VIDFFAPAVEDAELPLPVFYVGNIECLILLVIARCKDIGNKAGTFGVGYFNGITDQAVF